MPVQINEVIIKVIVDQPPGSGNPENVGSRPINESASEDILEKIFEIIQEKKER